MTRHFRFLYSTQFTLVFIQVAIHYLTTFNINDPADNFHILELGRNDPIQEKNMWRLSGTMCLLNLLFIKIWYANVKS